MRKEIKEGVRTIVIEGPVYVCSVLQDLVDPVKCFFELAATAIGIEKSEHVDTNSRI